jgi:hypothetical protein
VVSIGRSFDEYIKIFDLDENDLSDKKILDIAGGFSSFTAEANLKEIDTIALDKIYFFDEPKLKEIVKDGINKIASLVNTSHKFDYFKDFDDLLQSRKVVANLFLYDFTQNMDRYIGSNLPNINFKLKSFDIALISHLLFLYDDSFDLEFHKKVIKNALRVSKEVRIFPLVNLKCEKSQFLETILSEFDCEIKKVDYEFLKNANEVLIIR